MAGPQPLFAEAVAQPPRGLLAWLAVALLYAGGDILGLSWAQWGNASPIWPSTGIGVAAVFLLGPGIWTAILAGALAGNLLMQASLISAIAAALGSAAEAVLAWQVYRRLNGAVAPLADTRSSAHFVLAAAVIGPVASASLGVTSLALSGVISWALFERVWLTWWLANLSGAVVVGSACLAWWPGTGAGEWRGNSAEYLGILLAMAIASYLAFAMAGSGHAAYPLDFLPLPALLWAALRFGLRGASLVLLLLAGWAVWAAVHGHGVFANWPGMTGYWLLLLYILSAAAVMLAITAAARERVLRLSMVNSAGELLGDELLARTRERDQAQAQLAATRALLDLAGDAAPIVFWVVDAYGRVTLVGGALLEQVAVQLAGSGSLAAEELFRDEPALLAHIRQALAGRTAQGLMPVGGRLLRMHGEPVRDAAGNRNGAMGVGFEVIPAQ
jgi:integral membrane sensor domain MASE1